MAHGLEVRAPFLDTDLLELALRLPDSTRMARLSLKRAMKLAVTDLLPPEILQRRKQGFGLPLDRWFRTDLRDYIEGMLSPSARVRSYLEGGALDQMLAEHMSGSARHGHRLWTLLTLEVFLRQEKW